MAYIIVLSLIAIIAGALPQTLFFVLEFVFASAATLAIARRSLPIAIGTAVLAAGTVAYFHHLYLIAFLIVIETICIGLLMRRKINVIAAASMFWSIVTPILFFGIMRSGVHMLLAALIASKYFLNGLINAVIASLVVSGTPLQQMHYTGRKELISLREQVLTLLVGFVLVPGFAFMSIGSYYQASSVDRYAQAQLSLLQGQLTSTINQLHPDLARSRLADVPIRQTANIDGLQRQLHEWVAKASLEAPFLEATFFDIDGMIVASTSANLPVGTSIKGTEYRKIQNNDRLITVLHSNDSDQRQPWRTSFFASSRIADATLPISMVLQLPKAPMIERLYPVFFASVILLIVLTLASLTLADVLSTRLVQPLRYLATLTTHLPERLASGEEPTWPEEHTYEAAILARNLKSMALSLSQSFNRLQNANVDLERLAREDYLTGLANRRHFLNMLEKSISEAESKRDMGFGVLYIDLNGFKRVNDEMGHSAGDILLEAVASRLKRFTREYDMVARLGGDEFAVILPRISKMSEAGNAAQRICSSLADPFTLSGQKVYITAAYGAALFPTDGVDVSTLLKIADARMYANKSAAKSDAKSADHTAQSS
jgi:diguanylate cyclase (GGDEF)-like protein